MEQVYSHFIYEKDLALAISQLKRLEELEHLNDTTTHKLSIELGKNFITPFDREDIHTLASTLDDIADYMYAIAKQRINYKLLIVPRETQLIAEKMKPAVKLLCEILNSLENKNLVRLAVMSKEIKSILHLCDAMIDNALTDLFNKQKNAIETIKLTDHYNFLQAMVDKCEEAANVIESIIIKYG